MEPIAAGTIQMLRQKKNIDLVTTDLTGREAKDIAADFEFTEDGKKVIHCPAGNTPILLI